MRISTALPCLLLSLGFQVLAGPPDVRTPPSPPTPSPEVKKIVDAVVGRWTGSMKVSIPGVPPEDFPWSIDCRPVALGTGAACTMEGRASIGTLAQACLVACDPSSHDLHYMCVTSMGEVHDHRGRWTDDATIAFEPLAGVLQGKSMTETLAWSFPDPRRMTTKSIVTQEGGSMSFEFNGTKD